MAVGRGPLQYQSRKMRFIIEIYSDTSCPWCYLGKKALIQAIEEYREEHPDAQFDLLWRPYYLNPEAGSSEIDAQAEFINIVTRRHGTEAASTVIDRIERAGLQMGVEFNWKGMSGNTRASHKLMRLARERDQAHLAEAESRATRFREMIDSSTSNTHPDSRDDVGGLQARLLEALYTGIYRDEQDISDRRYLLRTAHDVGLADEEELQTWMNSDFIGQLVDAEAAQAREIEIQAVPAFVVQGHYRIGGYQEPAVFKRLFDKLRADAAAS